MTELLKIIPLGSSEPVQFVCYHPDMQQPVCLAVKYEYESILHEIVTALGWQGGTIHQVVEEIKRLKKKDV